jgi:hypothetical protein
MNKKKIMGTRGNAGEETLVERAACPKVESG